jgi:hypothetical protein
VSTLCNQEAGQVLNWGLNGLRKSLRNSKLKIFSGLARFLITTRVETLMPHIETCRDTSEHGALQTGAPAVPDQRSAPIRSAMETKRCAAAVGFHCYFCHFF